MAKVYTWLYHNSQQDWDTVKAFAKKMAEDLTAEEPELYIATMSKAKRKGKIFIDYLRNARSATAISAYSTRAHAGAPVSVPLRWEELATDVRGEHFGIRVTFYNAWRACAEIPGRATKRRGRALRQRDKNGEGYKKNCQMIQFRLKIDDSDFEIDRLAILTESPKRLRRITDVETSLASSI